MREDLGATPCAWLRPHFLPPSPFKVIKDKVAETLHILVQPHLIDAEFHKAWMPYFCRSGHPVVTIDQFLDFVDPFLPQERDLLEVARAKKSTAGGLDGWGLESD